MKEREAREKNGQIDLVYCTGDEGYEELLLSLLSVMRHTARPLFVTVLTACFDRVDGKGLGKEKAAYLGGLLQGRSDGSDLRLIDLTADLPDCFLSGRSTEGTRSPYPMLCLFLDLVAHEVENLLYLDGETVAAGDVGRLFDMDLKGRSYGAARESIRGLLGQKDYLCGGTILFHMPTAVKEGLFERAREVARETELCFSLASSLYFSDCKRRVLKRDFAEQEGLRKATVLRHYRKRRSFFPFLGGERENIREKRTLSKKEQRYFAGLYDQFYLYRDGYLR